MKSPNYQRSIYKAQRTAHILWVALLCVYAGVWRYLTSMCRGSPLSLTTNIVKHSPVAATENSLKFAIMRNFFLFFVFLIILGMTCTNELYAQKSITAMTETELSSLSDVQIKKGVIKEWSGILSFMMRGVKFDDRIVNAFAENFKAGALAWTKKEKYPTVDYVSAEDLVQFCKMWYIGRNSCKVAVMELHGRTYPTSIDKAMYRIMDATDVYYQKQQSGWLTKTPPEYIDAKSIISSMEP